MWRVCDVFYISRVLKRDNKKMKHFRNLSITVPYVLFLVHKAKVIIKCHAEKKVKKLNAMLTDVSGH